MFDTKAGYDNCENAYFQQWLLQKNRQAASDQELLTKHRYLDLISRELRKVDHMAEKQTKLRLKEDGIMTTLEENLVSVDKLKRNGRQRKCYLGQRLEKEDVRREARVEEQHKKMREIANRKD